MIHLHKTHPDSSSKTFQIAIGVLFLLITLVLGLLVTSPLAADEDKVEDAFKNGKFIFNGRLRYEHVEQGNIANDGDALTFLARFGFQTAKFKGFQLLAEGDITRDIGVNNFNSTVNGKTAFPVVVDPDSLRLNRLQLAYGGLKDTTIIAGRQRIILDNARFIGNVGFRQNEQTFDSARITTKALKGVTLDYVYLWKVNRIFGSQSAVGQIKTASHLINISTTELGIGKISAYAYLINLKGLAGGSNQTYGLRLSGKQDLGDGFSVVYVAGYAHQMEYANNPGNFSLNFLELEGGITYKGASAKAGFQLLEGNGTQGFTTPLATGHAFQGFADLFLSTPASGIEDFYFILGYKSKPLSSLGVVSFNFWYHDFSPNIAGPDLGEEVDFKVAIAPVIYKQKVTFAVKFANFFGASSLPDVRKIWLTANLVF